MLTRLPAFFRNDDPIRLARTVSGHVVHQVPIKAVEQLNEALERLFSVPQSAEKVLLILDELEPAIGQVFEQVRLELGTAEQNPVRFSLLVRYSSQLVNRMWNAYRQLLIDSRGSPSARVYSGFIDWTTMRVLFEQLLGGRIEPLEWRPILLPLRVEKDTDGLFSLERLQAASVRQSLACLTMLSTLVDGVLDLRQLLLAMPFLKLLSKDVIFNNRYQPESPFVLTLLTTGRPHWLEGWQLPEMDDRALFCGFEQAKLVCRNWCSERVRDNQFPPAWPVWKEQTLTETLAALGLMERAWTSRQAQRTEVRINAAQVLLCSFQLLRVRGLVARPHQTKPALELGVREGALLDTSSSGSGLYFEKADPEMRPSGLMGRYNDEDSSWSLSIIRRTRETEGGVFLGAQTLGHHPVAGRVLFDDAKVAGSDRLHVLFLEKAQGCKASGLLTASPLLPLGERCTIEMNKQQYTIEILDFVEAGVDYVLYDVDLL